MALKKKIVEWLELKKTRKSLEKAKLELHSTVEKKEPDFIKAEQPKKLHQIEDVVAGVRVPHAIKSFYMTNGHPVPYEHPLRESAAALVHKIHTKDKKEGARMSDKLLGIGEKGIATHPFGVSPEKRAKWKAPSKNKYVDVQKSTNCGPPLTHDERLDDPKNIKKETKNFKSVRLDSIYKK